MSTNRSRRIDRDAAEQLLGGAVGGPSAGQDASLTGPDGPGQLARVLAAAAAPATAAELAGEEAALAAFREASLTPDPVVTPIRRRSMATAALARAFSTKAAAAVLGATALCGVAVAAGTGNLPSGLGGPSEPEHTVATTGSPTGSSSGTPTGTGSGSASPGGTTRPSTGATTDPHRALPSVPGSPDPDGPTAGGHGDDRPTPPAALLPLCQGFADRTGKGERPRQLAADPLFAPLIAAAGGADGVQDYCAGAQGHQGDDHQGSGAQSGASGSGKGSGKGSGTGSGSGSGNGNSNGNTNGNANGNSNGEDTNGGGGAKPGKGGALPTPSGLPTLPDIRPSKTGHSEDDQAARR
ncbi:hypothetical protein ACFVXG_25705 [Kitasatospora sp. NPDC058162]|uniref:hypothetical protein n=1 Tax=Kitasatospora sp. NPDC058162 TaxID=3346362 RepID=UPI0036DAE05C